MHKDCEGCWLIPICIGNVPDCRLDKGANDPFGNRISTMHPSNLVEHIDKEQRESNTSSNKEYYKMKLHEAIEKLSENQRKCINLRFLGGMTEEKVAREIGHSRRYVRVNIERGIKRLKKILKEDVW